MGTGYSTTKNRKLNCLQLDSYCMILVFDLSLNLLTYDIYDLIALLARVKLGILFIFYLKR